MEKKLVHLTIDGRPIVAEEGQNVVEVAKANGIFIPSLCYYPHIDPPLGSCRVCTVMANGRSAAACTTLVKEGMDVVVNTDELQDWRKAVVEMMYAEGNHFCPSCEKSGDCDLQGLGYNLGVTVSRFPHLFVDHVVDYNPQRMVIEHNRCIRCRRCVEEVLTDEGQRVFSFQNRGNTTEVGIDYEQEAKLTHEQAMQAMHVCPVGAILVRGKSLARPRGDRKYDHDTVVSEVPLPKITALKPHLRRKKSPPPHFAIGKYHFAFEVASADYEKEKAALMAKGIKITDEVTWRNGLKSSYFEDPAGNVLEIVPEGVWD